MVADHWLCGMIYQDRCAPLSYGSHNWQTLKWLVEPRTAAHVEVLELEGFGCSVPIWNRPSWFKSARRLKIHIDSLRFTDYYGNTLPPILHNLATQVAHLMWICHSLGDMPLGDNMDYVIWSLVPSVVAGWTVDAAQESSQSWGGWALRIWRLGDVVSIMVIFIAIVMSSSSLSSSNHPYCCHETVMIEKIEVEHVYQKL